jgi:hypothetical protein
MLRRTIILALAGTCLAAGVAAAQTYKMPFDAFGSAGSPYMSNGTVRLGMTLGQPVAGLGAAASLPAVEGAGFWHWGMRPTLDAPDAPGVQVIAFALLPNSPNPFSTHTSIRYAIPAASADQPVSLRIYDLSGRLVRTLSPSRRAPGIHESAWDGLDQAGHVLGGGIYFCRMTAGPFTATRRLVLAR